MNIIYILINILNILSIIKSEHMQDRTDDEIRPKTITGNTPDKAIQKHIFKSFKCHSIDISLD